MNKDKLNNSVKKKNKNQKLIKQWNLLKEVYVTFNFYIK